MLLCEACDVGYHYDCLTPPLKGSMSLKISLRNKTRSFPVRFAALVSQPDSHYRRARMYAGIPEESWFCCDCLAKFGDAGPPAWTSFNIGTKCVACFEDDKRPESQAKWVCKILDIRGTLALLHFPGTGPAYFGCRFHRVPRVCAAALQLRRPSAAGH